MVFLFVFLKCNNYDAMRYFYLSFEHTLAIQFYKYVPRIWRGIIWWVDVGSIKTINPFKFI